MDLLSRMLLTAGEAPEPITGLAYIANTTAVATQTNSNTSITLTGIQSGDVVFFTWASDILTPSTLESSWASTEGSIWSKAPGGTATTSTPYIATYYKVATGNSITVDTGHTPTSDSSEYSMSLIAFRGLNTTDPMYFIGSTGSIGTSLQLADYTTGLADFNSYLFAVVGLDDDQNVTLTPPGTYTKINQVDPASTVNDNSTQSSAYSTYTANTTRSGESYTSDQSDSYETFLWLLVPSGEEAAPVISGSSSVQAAAGGTAVATYTANNTVTWSLGGANASLFSISSGGVVTYNSASVLGRYNIDVIATNSNNLRTVLPVIVDAYETSGNPGGNITFVGAVSDVVTSVTSTTLTLNGLQSGDVVYFMAASDSNDGTYLTESGGWSGWSSQTALEINSPDIFRRSKVTSGTSESLTLQVTIGTAAYVMAVALFAFRGVDNTDPILLGGTLTTSSGSTINLAADYMLADTVRIAWAGLDDDEGETTTPPTGYTEIVDQNSVPGGTSLSGATLAVAYKNVTGNTTEAVGTFTFTSSDACSSSSWQLRPN